MNFKKWSLTIALCLTIFGGLAAYKVSEIRRSVAAAEAYPEQSEVVEQALVTTGEYTPAITVMAEIIAPKRLDIRNELAGEITTVNFQSGEIVQQGQLLLQMDIATEQANLEAARARADLSRLVMNRSKELYNSNLASEEQLDTAVSQLTSAEAEIAVLERTIEKKTLRAPFSGRVGIHSFEAGQYLSANTLITSLIGSTGEIWVDFQIPQFYPQLPIGSAVTIKTINNRSNENGLQAIILAENTIINAGNRSRGYRASLNSDLQTYPPQTIVNISAPVAPPELVLQVPSVSVQYDPLGSYVFLLREDPSGNSFRAARQQVKIKLVGSEFTLLEPETGLKAGDIIASAGAFKLYDGIKVFTAARPQRGKATEAGTAVDMSTDAVSAREAP
ncbi:efflux RND transporter periplasmic adaptor subunit [Gammaproteobacteria bacterium]|nr:efflux RND transporter periplasmic adaptor subunit [Gammaproteobacteria bacterium]